MPEVSDSLKVLFVINPISGGKIKTDWESAIREYFKPLPHHCEFFILNGKNDAASLQHWITNVRPNRVVAVGGDGTVTFVAKHLLQSPISMGILPAGSANGMARDLDIPTDVNEALNIVVNGQIKCADVILVNDAVCLHLSDIGINARLIKYFEEGKWRGKWGYARVVLKALLRKEPMQVIIQLKDIVVRREAFMVVLANASKYGTGAVINPVGNLYDGLFEVVIIRKLAISELLKMLIIPRPFNPKKIELFQAESINIETQHRVHFQIDGEYQGKVRSITGKIMPAQLNLLLPDL
jgi:diacylglycerol kinase (ATP)